MKVRSLQANPLQLVISSGSSHEAKVVVNYAPAAFADGSWQVKWEVPLPDGSRGGGEVFMTVYQLAAAFGIIGSDDQFFNDEGTYFRRGSCLNIPAKEGNGRPTVSVFLTPGVRESVKMLMEMAPHA